MAITNRALWSINGPSSFSFLQLSIIIIFSLCVCRMPNGKKTFACCNLDGNVLLTLVPDESVCVLCFLSIPGCCSETQPAGIRNHTKCSAWWWESSLGWGCGSVHLVSSYAGWHSCDPDLSAAAPGRALEIVFWGGKCGFIYLLFSSEFIAAGLMRTLFTWWCFFTRVYCFWWVCELTVAETPGRNR